MNNKIIENFAEKYGANINYNHTRNNFDTYARSMDYYDGRSTVDIELSFPAFEHLVKMDNQAEEEYQKHREEARIRMQYPSVADAYHKYKMLLELCK
jgi:NH3-dependent NAD+ synthetase